MDMYCSSISKKTKKSSDDNMIPLINIIFLLLIFYMVAGTIEPSQVEDLELPKMSNERTTEKAAITLQITHKNAIYLNNKQHSLQSLALAIQRIKKPENSIINIHADHRVNAKQLDEVLNTLRENNAQQLALMSKKISK